MRAIAFDTLEYMKDLKKSGMREEEAEAIVTATQKALGQLLETHDVATKSDITNVRSEIKNVKSDIQLELHSFKTELQSEIQNVRIEMHSMKADLLKLMHENMWKTVGILATIQTLVLGIFGIINYLK